MKTNFNFLTKLCVLTFLLVSLNGFTQNLVKGKQFADNEIIVCFKTQIPKFQDAFEEIEVLKKLNDSIGVLNIHSVGNKKIKNCFRIVFKTKQSIDALIRKYSATDLFDFVEPNYIGTAHGALITTPNDPFYNSRQWSHNNNGTFTLSLATSDADIDTDLAWNITQGDPNLIVAILDSGLKLDHPEFVGRLVSGYDFVNNDTNPTDDHGHGTNVAGIALATGNNTIGYAGVNWKSKIMALKVLDGNNNGLYSWWADAIYFAVDNGAKVINLSAGGDSASLLLENAINYAYTNNVSVVVSTGNGNTSIQYPAKYQNAIAVGSTNPNDTRTNPFFWSPTSGSNYGPEIDFVAPGNYIYGLSHLSNTDFNLFWGGTSQAAPLVTGVISLLLSQTPTLTVSQIIQRLRQTSEDMIGDSQDTSGWDQYYGYGRINAFNALTNMNSNTIGLVGTATESGNFETDYVMTTTDEVNYTLNNIFLSTTGTLQSTPGEVKFRMNGNWTVNWGGNTFPSGIGSQGGSNILVTQSGYYNVTLNVLTGAYTFTYLGPPPTISIIGSNIGTAWATDLNLSSTNGRNYVLNNRTLVQGQAKFRQNGGWLINWGNTAFPSGVGFQEGPNIPIAAGTYDISFNRYTGAYSFSTSLNIVDINANSNEFILYPNPANYKVTLKSGNYNLGNIKVSDVLGKTLFETTCTNNEIVLDCSDYPNGFYFITLLRENQIITKKLIVDK